MWWICGQRGVALLNIGFLWCQCGSMPIFQDNNLNNCILPDSVALDTWNRSLHVPNSFSFFDDYETMTMTWDIPYSSLQTCKHSVARDLFSYCVFCARSGDFAAMATHPLACSRRWDPCAISFQSPKPVHRKKLKLKPQTTLAGTEAGGKPNRKRERQQKTNGSTSAM